MIRSLFASLCVFLGGCADAAPPSASAGAPAATVRNIDVAALKADLDRAAVPLLIDVRTPGEFAGGHVPSAKNVPLDQLEARIGELGSADAEVYVVCQSGARSARASASLAAKGLHPVNITGGTSAWRTAGFPVE
ncbi:MAG: rhodanese-like domain-containing protein [Pseudomonadota bacterium]|nr:rhodanese-like domain-containing protein [Pseudomonadota bacterium]